MPSTSSRRLTYTERATVGICILVVAIVVGVIMPMRVMVVIPPRVVMIIITLVEGDRGIAATAGDKHTETAEDQEDSRYHGVYPFWAGRRRDGTSVSTAAMLTAVVCLF
jgi:hypothetical protein